MSDVFAVIPAAGQSRRMGQPKLLLPYRGRTLIAHLLSALWQTPVRCVAVVLRQHDSPLRTELTDVADRHGVLDRLEIVAPEVDPPDMCDSVRHGLHALETRFSPNRQDWWWLIPADHPLVTREILEESLAAAESASQFGGTRSILVPTHAGRRGHPTLFAWHLVDEVRALPRDQGLNRLVRQNPIRVGEYPSSHAEVLADLDTPEDCLRWLGPPVGESPS